MHEDHSSPPPPPPPDYMISFSPSILRIGWWCEELLVHFALFSPPYTLIFNFFPPTTRVSCIIYTPVATTSEYKILVVVNVCDTYCVRVPSCHLCTVCPRSFDPTYILTYCMKRVNLLDRQYTFSIYFF